MCLQSLPLGFNLDCSGSTQKVRKWLSEQTESPKGAGPAAPFCRECQEAHNTAHHSQHRISDLGNEAVGVSS